MEEERELTQSSDKPDTQAVFYCLSTDSWCCLPPQGAVDLGATLNTTCCTISDLEFTAADPVVYTHAQLAFLATATPTAGTSSTVTSLSSVAVAASSTLVSTTIPSQPSPSASVSPSSSGTSSSSNSKIGIYVGVPLGVVLAIALGVIAWLVMRRRKATRSPAVPGPPVYQNTEKYPAHGEADMDRQPSELPGGRQFPVELSGTNMK